MKNLNYILMVLAGGISFGILSSFVKLAYAQGYNAAEISFSQAFLGAFMLWSIVFFKFKGKKSPLAIDRDFLHLLFSGTGIGMGTYLYYQSVYYIPASLAIVILMQFTWFSLLIEWILFKKRPSGLEIGVVFFILLGTILAGNLLYVNNLDLSIKGILLSLLASIAYAFYIVTNSHAAKKKTWEYKSAVMMTGSALAIFIVNFHTLFFSSHFNMGLLQWALFLSVFGTVIPPILFAIGIPKIGAGISSIIMTVELPVAVLTAYIVLGEQMTVMQIVGIVVMLVSISIIKFNKAKT